MELSSVVNGATAVDWSDAHFGSGADRKSAAMPHGIPCCTGYHAAWDAMPLLCRTAGLAKPLQATIVHACALPT